MQLRNFVLAITIREPKTDLKQAQTTSKKQFLQKWTLFSHEFFPQTKDSFEAGLQSKIFHLSKVRDSFTLYHRPCNVTNLIIAPYIIPPTGKMANKEWVTSKSLIPLRGGEIITSTIIHERWGYVACGSPRVLLQSAHNRRNKSRPSYLWPNEPQKTLNRGVYVRHIGLKKSESKCQEGNRMPQDLNKTMQQKSNSLVEKVLERRLSMKMKRGTRKGPCQTVCWTSTTQKNAKKKPYNVMVWGTASRPHKRTVSRPSQCRNRSTC